MPLVHEVQPKLAAAIEATASDGLAMAAATAS